MQKLNILISHTSVYKKSGWGRIFPLAKGLAKQGQQVTIITTNTNFSLFTKRKIIDNVNIIIFPEIIPSRVSRMGFGFLSLFLEMLHVVFHKYDVVQSDNGHRPLAGMPCRLSKRLHKSVYVAEWYDWYGKGGQYDTKKKLFKILLGWYELKYEIKDKKVADGVVVLSEVLRERAKTFKTEDKIVKIHGGADVLSIPFVKENSVLKLKYDIDEDTLTFGYINAKGFNISEVLPLANAIINNNESMKIKILIFGDSQIDFSILPQKFREHIVSFGWVDFSKDYEKLLCVDVFFLFKKEDLRSKAGWPNCIGDYIACGRHILIDPVGEVIDFAKKYSFPFIMTSKSEIDIWAKVKYIAKEIASLKEERIMIRKLAEDVISWESKSKELLSFYLYLLEHG
ncbi:Glycosyltransferase Family 4 [Tangfeifania diversioriginum]|uniref:Glycosyltransferase Family 4 n=1 Tax=Tangfeifania diversioriginum TaxID=1168035 RepID=A0A1M6NND0_9BACT|nr:glycosyltransferase [Tangfeifania diversioriginum]SHJ97249.1 Glycosyltransferase Family 4 [Tangfeifania diversioriginum]